MKRLLVALLLLCLATDYYVRNHHLNAHQQKGLTHHILNHAKRS